jgi:hypothetical protein
MILENKLFRKLKLSKITLTKKCAPPKLLFVIGKEKSVTFG